MTRRCSSSEQQAEPGKPAILRRIIVLAFNLDRRAEAARYAQLLESHDPDDAVLLRRLALELTDQRDRHGAPGMTEMRGESTSMARPRSKPTKKKAPTVSSGGWKWAGSIT